MGVKEGEDGGMAIKLVSRSERSQDNGPKEKLKREKLKKEEKNIREGSDTIQILLWFLSELNKIKNNDLV